MKKSDVKAGMLITADILRKLGACSDQYERFASFYPKGCRLNTRNLNTVYRRHMQTPWLVDRVMYEYQNNRESMRQFNLYRKKYASDRSLRRVECFHSAFIAILKERDT